MTHALMDVATPSDGEMSFDYGDMAKEAMEDLEEQAGRITALKRRVQRLAVETALHLGRILMEAQSRFSRCGNGTFIKWWKERCGIEKTQAYRLISVCQAFGECPTVGQTFDISALYTLSEQACPNEARAEAMRLAQDGHHVSKRLALEIRGRHEQGCKEHCDSKSSSPDDLAGRISSDLARLFRKWQRQGASPEFIRERLSASMEQDPGLAEPVADDQDPTVQGDEPASSHRELVLESDDAAQVQEFPDEALTEDVVPSLPEQDCEELMDDFTEADASEKAQSGESGPVDNEAAESEEEPVLKYENRGDRLLFTKKCGTIVYRRQRPAGSEWLHLSPGQLKDRLEQAWEAQMAKRGAHKTL